MNPGCDGRPTPVWPARDQTRVVLVRRGVELGSWPLSGCGRVDLVAVHRLARWQLAARRVGCSILVRQPSRELVALLDLCGLVEVVGQAEGAEQPRVEEVVQGGDPVA